MLHLIYEVYPVSTNDEINATYTEKVGETYNILANIARSARAHSQQNRSLVSSWLVEESIPAKS